MICGKLSVLRSILSANVKYNTPLQEDRDSFVDIRKDFLFPITTW